MGLTLDEVLHNALEHQGSDVFIVPGSPIVTKASGKMIQISEGRLLPTDVETLVNRAYELAGRGMEILESETVHGSPLCTLKIAYKHQVKTFRKKVTTSSKD